MNNLTVLHIANDYSGSGVYKNLIEELDKLGITQIVYTPVREQSSIYKNKIDLKTSGSEIIYSHILNKTTDRAFYPLKIKKILRDIKQKVDISKVKFIHAHTWYSDGGAAYLLSKQFNIPYIVAIRNTDLNLFQKRLVYLRPFGRRILLSAKHVITIAPTYKRRILDQSSLRVIKTELNEKIRIIPNGVDPYWIRNAVYEKKSNISASFNILYIGKFNRGKNVVALQEAVKLLSKEKNKNIQLHIVGGGGNQTQKVLANVERFPGLYKYYGEVYDKDELLKIYRSCDIFAMPSRHETFGLVYIEAMLQGLPVMYRKNEGIDGYYTEKIGEAVTVGDVADIKNKLELLCEHYNHYELNIPLLAKNHDWRLIAGVYKDIYK
ncbi:MAG TPA: glycosyltransferase family 4 protein [Niabella sp.]|nr:glycosyltransferase family 4 protein [Agriterribacter sp.]HUN01325.1 glycosyltransferase family 4 protein [Niabella sp.]